MNRALWIVLGPTAIVAVGYVFVLRAIGLQPPYLKLLAVLVLVGIGFAWVGKKDKASSQPK